MEAKAIMKADDYYAGFDRGMEVGKKVGRSEVMEWLESRPKVRQGFGFVIYHGMDWQSKLKEWEIEKV